MFTLNHLRDLLATRPFVPFRLHRSDGGSVDVRSSEVVSAGRQMAVIGLLDPDQADTAWDRFVIVWYLRVTSVEMLGPGPAPLAPPPAPSGPSEMPAPAH